MPKQSQPRLILTILSVASFMASLDLFIVNVAFDRIGHDFHGESLSNLSWILNGYAIIYAALLVPLGRLADRFGRKAGFIAGLSLFVLASVACAASTGLWMLVAFRVLQAVGAAALTPTSLGLLLPVFAPDKRAGAVRIWAASGALAAAAGPVIGGLLVTLSWRWVFLVNLPIGLVALVLAVRHVPDARDETVTRTPDLLGVGVLTAAIALLSLGLVKINDWPGVRTAVVLALSLLLISGFWRRSLRHASPVIEPALLKVRAFTWSNATSLLFAVAFGANLLVTVLWMQEVWHYSPIRTGLGVAPGPLMVPLFSIIAGRLIARGVPIGRVAAVGCLVFGLGIATVAWRVGLHPEFATEMLPGGLLTGMGVGFALPTILAAGTADLPPARFSTGSGIVNMTRQIGTVLGVSILVAVSGTPVGAHAVAESFQHTRVVLIGVCVLSALAALGMTPRGRVTEEELVPVAELVA